MSLSFKVNRYRDKLHALREHLDAQTSSLPDDVFDVADSADRANQQSEVAVNVSLAAHEAVLRKEVDDALERISSGTFAICEKCHAAISTSRLNAIPYARYCVYCERHIEQERTFEVGLEA